jgi:hypothetical protein
MIRRRVKHYQPSILLWGGAIGAGVALFAQAIPIFQVRARQLAPLRPFPAAKKWSLELSLTLCFHPSVEGYLEEGTPCRCVLRG